jgi:hypothetical protein
MLKLSTFFINVFIKKKLYLDQSLKIVVKSSKMGALSLDGGEEDDDPTSSWGAKDKWYKSMNFKFCGAWKKAMVFYLATHQEKMKHETLNPCNRGQKPYKLKSKP